MVENLGKWPSKRGPISKIRPSDGYGRDAVPLTVERWYSFPESGGYLENVGSWPCILGEVTMNLKATWGMSDKVLSLHPPFERIVRKHRSHKNPWARVETNFSQHAAFHFIRILTVVVLSASFTFACDQAPQKKQQSAAAPPAVTVAFPVQQRITEWDEFTGRFEAVETVEIRSRVSGFLESKHFNDGQEVNKGDLLFKIDPRPFEISLAQATARVDQAASQLQLAKSDAERATNLSLKGNISKQRLETSQALVRERKALLKAAKARVLEVKLDLEWSEVRSPITGRPSDARLDIGNLISGGPTNSTLFRSKAFLSRTKAWLVSNPCFEIFPLRDKFVARSASLLASCN